MLPEETRSLLREKERHFREFSVWPIHSEFDTEGWLRNFTSEEASIAESLLSNFSYFNEEMTNALFYASIQNFFSIRFSRDRTSSASVSTILDRTAFIICQGEEPHPADSGHIFARKLRDRFDIPQYKIFSPEDALKSRNKFDIFIFVDDFSGSGNQFIETWERVHRVGGVDMSFQTFSANARGEFAYCCCVSTSKAKLEIGKAAPSVILSPAHLLSLRHSAVNAASAVWRDVDHLAGIWKIKQASIRAGYDREDEGVDDWRGFHKLGLSLAFDHGIPDASLPIYFSNRNGWRPLMRRNDP